MKKTVRPLPATASHSPPISAHQSSAKDSGPILQLKNVGKTYCLGDQQITALSNINFAMRAGEFVSIMGPSGSGKSTFLQVASILATISSGEIWLKGKNVSDYNEVARAKLRNREIGFIFQSFNLLAKTSALDNVCLPLIYAGVPRQRQIEKAQAMLELVGLGQRLHNQPNQLSGGQQQRVAIARALINDPSIIFADEPTGNLDSQSGQDIINMLLKLHQQGKTIILVTHEKKLGALADRQLRLKDGQITQDVIKKS